MRGAAFLTLQGRFRLDVRRVQQDVEAGSTGSGPGPRGHINTLAAHCRSVPSVLAKRGVPDHVIQSVGRWKSLAFLAYTSLATRAYNDAVEKLCDIGSLTMADIRRMVPGTKRA